MYAPRFVTDAQPDAPTCALMLRALIDAKHDEAAFDVVHDLLRHRVGVLGVSHLPRISAGHCMPPPRSEHLILWSITHVLANQSRSLSLSLSLFFLSVFLCAHAYHQEPLQSAEHRLPRCVSAVRRSWDGSMRMMFWIFTCTHRTNVAFLDHFVLKMYSRHCISLILSVVRRTGRSLTCLSCPLCVVLT